MSRSEVLREDLFDLGETFPEGAHGFVLARTLVDIGKSLRVNPNLFLADVQKRLMALEPTFEDITLFELPPTRDINRYKRLVTERIRALSQVSNYETLSVVLASLSDVVMKRGLPKGLAYSMVVSEWTGAPLVTVAPPRLRKEELNG